MSAPVAVAVVSWNTRDLLADALRSLAADADAGRAEVWVVDNGSTDGSIEMVREQFPWVTLQVSGENLGFGRAVNLVAQRTDSPWIAPANSDIELAPGALARLLDAGAADPSLAAVVPRLMLPGGDTQPSLNRFPGPLVTLVYELRLFRLHARLGDWLGVRGYWDPSVPRRGGWPTGAFLIARREAFEAVGGFDEDQWLYAEDLDLGWRLRRAGWEVASEPSAIVRHVMSAATGKAFEDGAASRWTAARYVWLVKRRGAPVALATAALGTVTAAVRAALLLPAAALHGRRWGPRLAAARRDLQRHARGLRALFGRRPR